MKAIKQFFLAGALLAPLVSYGGFTLGLDTEFSGATAPEGTAPWVTLGFDDSVPGTVTLTVSTANLTDQEFVSELYLNFIDSKGTSLLGISAPSNADVTVSSVNKSAPLVSQFKADGDGWFDIKIDFANSGAGRFQASESLVATFTLSGITADDFYEKSAASKGSATTDILGTGLFAAAHVQGIGSSNSLSGWITGDKIISTIPPIPEPSAFIMAITGIFATFLLARRRN